MCVCVYICVYICITVFSFLLGTARCGSKEAFLRQTVLARRNRRAKDFHLY